MDDKIFADVMNANRVSLDAHAVHGASVLFEGPLIGGLAAQDGPRRSRRAKAAGMAGEPGDDGKLKADAVVLLVEDNIIFSLDAEDMLRRLGVAAVVTRSETQSAIEVIGNQAIDFAVLDINLGEETSLPVAAHLRTAGIPFAFVSDFDDPTILPQEFEQVPVLAKPYTMEGLGRILPL